MREGDGQNAEDSERDEEQKKRMRRPLPSPTGDCVIIAKKQRAGINGTDRRMEKL
jgi:hypothetical protein